MNGVRTTKNISITMPIAMLKDTERLTKRDRRAGKTLSTPAPDALSTLAPTEQYDTQWVTRVMEEAKMNPLTPEELEADYQDLAAYGARQAKKLGVKERVIVRLIHEFRAQRKA